MTQVEMIMEQPKRSLFANVNFLILWLGQGVSQFGDKFFHYALSIWIIRAYGAPALGVVMMAASIPGILLGPVAGTFADRLDRKKIIVYSDFFRGGLVLMAAWLMYQHTFSLLHIYVLLIVFGILQPLFGSAISASLPNVVGKEDLSQANSLRQAASSSTGLVGPALAAIILVALGGAERAIPLFFVFKGITYILSGISEMFLVLPKITHQRASSKKEAVKVFSGQLMEGVSYVWKSRLLMPMIITFAAINFFTAPLGTVVIPAVIIDYLGLDEMWLGFIQSGMAAGFLLASLVLSAIKRLPMAKVMIFSLMGMGVSVIFMGLTMGAPSIFAFLADSPLVVAYTLIPISALIGVTAATTSIIVSTMMQKVVPDEKRGRVFSFLNTLGGGLVPLALGSAGLLAIAFPLFIHPIIGGACIIGATSMLARVKELYQH